MADDQPRDDGDGQRSSGESAPLDDLADRIRSRRGEEAAGEAAAGDEEGFGLDEFFQEETFEAVESDQLWETIEERPSFEDGDEVVEAPDEAVVSKRQYCESCEYFSAPPEVHCDHPGTTIVEFVDIDHVRVRNCPIVAERQTLGDDEESPMTQMSFGSGES